MANTAKLLPRLLVLALGLSAFVVVQSSSPAHVCSCLPLAQTLAQPEPRSFEAAFVGTVLQAPERFTNGSSARLVTWKFQVDEVYRGQLPATVDVKSPISGVSCGFEGLGVGSKVGVLLRREGGDWQSGLCSSGAPAQLAVLGAPSPPSGEVVQPTGAPASSPESDDGGLSTGAVVAIWGGVILVAVAGAALFTSRRRSVRGEPAPHSYAMRSLACCLTLALVFAAIVVVQSASPAHACSCVAIDTQIAQRETFPFDAAFVGRVSEVSGPVADANGKRMISLTFLVDAVYYGDLPPTVQVKSATSGLGCGLENATVGTEEGVLLRRVDGDDWTAGICSTGSSERFALLGPPKKPFVGAPPPTVVGITIEPDDGGLSTGALMAIGGGVITAAVAGVFVATRRRGAAT